MPDQNDRLLGEICGMPVYTTDVIKPTDVFIIGSRLNEHGDTELVASKISFDARMQAPTGLLDASNATGHTGCMLKVVIERSM